MCLAPALARGQAAVQTPPPSDHEYLDTLRDHLAGDPDASARATRWPADGVRAAVRRLADPGSRVLASAVLLHATIARREGGDVARTHLSAAFDAARRFEGVDRAALDEGLARLSYAVVLSQLQGALDISGIELLIDSALRVLPDDPEVLLARGSLHETTIALPPEGRGPTRPRRVAERSLAAAAERDYRRALERAPNLADAQVRLGRVLYRQRKLDEAREQLERARSAAMDLPLQYFAALFLGVVHEEAGRLDAAERCYTEAQDLFARAQAPRLALAHLQHRRGRWQRAADLIAAGEAIAPETVTDPWWVYDYGQFWRVDDRLAALREALAR